MAAAKKEPSSPAPASPDQRHLLARFAHPHYVLNSLLALPLPVLLSYHLWLLNASTGLDRNTLLAILAAPSLMSVSVMTSRWDFAGACTRVEEEGRELTSGGRGAVRVGVLELEGLQRVWPVLYAFKSRAVLAPSSFVPDLLAPYARRLSLPLCHRS